MYRRIAPSLLPRRHVCLTLGFTEERARPSLNWKMARMRERGALETEKFWMEFQLGTKSGVISRKLRRPIQVIPRRYFRTPAEKKRNSVPEFYENDQLIIFVCI